MTLLKQHEKIALLCWSNAELIDVMVNYHKDLPKQFIIDRLQEFEDTHGVRAITALYGFYLYAKANKMTSAQTWPVIMADIDKRNKPDAILNTTDYYTVTEDYFYNHFVNTLTK